MLGRCLRKASRSKGRKHYTGSDPHKAAVVGGTGGDPFRDTAGRSINIPLKLISIVALIIGPLIRQGKAKTSG